MKVSYVEPGDPGTNVMFRSKQVIFETQPVEDNSNDPEWNAPFEYNIYRPASGDWRDLEGDLLFTIYEDQGQRRIFVGQALVPLLHLLDYNSTSSSQIKGRLARVHGGTQRVGTELFPLSNRDESLARGTLALELRLELPPDEPVNVIGDSLSSTGTDSEKHTIDHRSLAASSTHSRRVGKKVKSKTPAIHPAEARAMHLQRQRQRQQQKLDQENRNMQKRIRKAKSSMAPTAREMSESKATEAWRKKKANSAFSQQHQQQQHQGPSEMELRSMTREAGELRQSIVALKDEITHMRAGIARDETILRRQRILEEQMDRAHQESKSRGVVRKARAHGPRQAVSQLDNMIGTDQPSEKDLREIHFRLFRALDAHRALNEEAQTLLQRRTYAQEKAAECVLAVEKATQSLQNIRKEEKTKLRQVRDGDILASSDLHDLRIAFSVAKNDFVLQQRAYEHDENLLADDIERLKGKIERKMTKIEQAQVDLEHLHSETAEIKSRHRKKSAGASEEITRLQAAIAQLLYAKEKKEQTKSSRSRRR